MPTNKASLTLSSLEVEEQSVKEGADKVKRSKISQTDVPGCSLEQALRIPRAIAEQYAFKPTAPLRVASAMQIQPTSGSFRSLTGAAIAYGLTTGGSNAPEIAITPLGLKILRPTEEGQEIQGQREALLKPRVIGEFLRKYDGAAFPRRLWT